MWLLALVVWIASTVFAFLLPFNFDAAWLYYVAEQVLNGQHLYVDIIENNPPLIIWLSMPPVLLAHLMSLPPRIAFTIYVLFVLGGSVLLSAAVLRRTLPNRPFGRRALLLVLPVVLIQIVFPAFGEREHLMVALVLPYLLLAAGRVLDRPFQRRLAVGAGIVAAIGIALKPHFLLLPVAVELYLLFRVPRRAVFARPELWTLGVLVIAYAAVAALLTPEYASVVELTRQTYWAMSVPFDQLLTKPLFLGSILIFAVAGLLPLSPEIRPLRTVLLLAGGAFAASMLSQQKGWFYHQYPVVAAAAIVMAVVLIDKVENASSSTARRRLRLLLTGAFVGVLMFVSVAPILMLRSITLTEDMLRPTLDSYAPGGSVLFLSTEIGNAFPLVTNAGMQLVSPVHSLQILPGFYRKRPEGSEPVQFHAPAEQPPSERWLFDAVVSKVVAERPDLIVVNTAAYQPGFGRHSFDYIGYFEQDPRFARLMRKYSAVAEIPPFLIYSRTVSTAE